MKDTEEIREALPIEYVLSNWYGHTLSQSGRGRCPICKGRNKTKFRLTENKLGWVCAGECGHGDVFSLIEKLEGLAGFKEVMEFVESKGAVVASSEAPVSQCDNKTKSKAKMTLEAEYVYRKDDGSEAYVVKRLWNHDARRKEVIPYTNGRAGLKTENRILYNLNRIVTTIDQPIFIVEGEKCADALSAMGYVATTCTGGSSQWKKDFDYAKHLEDKDIIIMPDSDESGDKWLGLVLDDVKGKVESARIIHIPKEFVKEYDQISGHDIADYIEKNGEDEARRFINESADDAKELVRGYDSKSLRPQDCYKSYRKMVKKGNFVTLDFQEWLPSINVQSRRGDMIGILAGTGVGKGRTLMNLMYNCPDTMFLVFDLELSAETNGERWCALHNMVNVTSVREMIESDQPYDMPALNNIRIVPCGGIDVEFIKERIKAEEAMLRKEIPVIVVDYLGLMKGSAGSRYETMSAAAEALKALANDLQKTVIITVQRSRPQDKEEGLYQCPSAFDAKDSGSIENSCQILMGMFKFPPSTCGARDRLGMKLLKYTHGSAGDDVKATIDAYDLRLIEAGDERPRRFVGEEGK